MKLFLSRYLFVICLIILSVLFSLVEWFVCGNKFTSFDEPSEFDLVSRISLFLYTFHSLLFFTHVVLLTLLGLFLLFKSKLDSILIKNIYYSMIYLLLSILVIETFFFIING
jgi:hypothetical protein